MMKMSNLKVQRKDEENQHTRGGWCWNLKRVFIDLRCGLERDFFSCSKCFIVIKKDVFKSHLRE